MGAQNGQILVKAAAPAATVLLLPLLPKRICSTPLAQSLLSALQQSSRASLKSQSLSCASVQHGVLTLDQGRSLVPLHAADAQVHDRLLKADRTCDVCQRLTLWRSSACEEAWCRSLKVVIAGSGSAHGWSVGGRGTLCQGCPCVGCMHPLPAVSRLARQGPPARHGLLGARLCAW